LNTHALLSVINLGVGVSAGTPPPRMQFESYSDVSSRSRAK